MSGDVADPTDARGTLSQVESGKEGSPILGSGTSEQGMGRDCWKLDSDAMSLLAGSFSQSDQKLGLSN
jgi:hypothetical protein